MIIYKKIKASLSKQVLTKKETTILKGGKNPNFNNEIYSSHSSRSHGHPPPFDEL